MVSYASRGYLGGGRGVAGIPTEPFAFACTFALSSVISASIVLALGGRATLAVQFAALSISLLAIASVIVSILFWVVPSSVWPLTRLNLQHFLQFSRDITSIAALL